jgi:hypothetical protein
MDLFSQFSEFAATLCQSHVLSVFGSERWQPRINTVDMEDYEMIDLQSGGIASAAKRAIMFYTFPCSQGDHSGIDVLNSIVRLGIKEAADIWPTKNLDTLVMLSSGYPKSMVRQRQGGVYIEPPVPKTITTVRLDPALQHNVRFDDVRRIMLGQVLSDAVLWLQQHNDEMTTAANRLIAGLFFYRSLSLPQASHQLGEVSCRLPLDLQGKTQMIAHLIKVSSQRRLFSVICEGGKAKIETKPVSTSYGQDLFIRIDIEKDPTVNQFKLDIVMANIFSDFGDWYPISGCPYMA